MPTVDAAPRARGARTGPAAGAGAGVRIAVGKARPITVPKAIIMSIATRIAMK